MTTNMITYSDIFVPGGFPRHTYNPRVELQLEYKLGEVKNNLCKLVAVTGHTKAGKTVLVRKILPPEDSIWIDGGTVSQEDDFWDVVIEQLSVFQSVVESTSTGSENTVEGKAKGGASFIIAKGEGELSGSITRLRGAETTKSRAVSSRVTALAALRGSRLPLIIDDFHYLPKTLQGGLVRALKPLIFDGLPVVIIAIPHRRYDAIKVEREMTGRMYPIDIPVWSETELRFIPETGFRLLNLEVPHNIVEKLAAEAIGSPHLIQDFCRTISRIKSIVWQHNTVKLDVSDTELSLVFRDVANTIGRPIFEKLARGPRQRTDRLPRKLKDGRKVDIYQLVLLSLAQIKPGLVTLEYEQLRTAIKEVSASQIPQLHEVARALKHMATIAATDQSSTPVIDFDDSEKKLHITDPFFAFYLRWGDLSG